LANNLLFENDGQPKELHTFKIPPTISAAIAECKWPGRSQKLQCGKILYHLDGAHTPMSIQVKIKKILNLKLILGLHWMVQTNFIEQFQ